jgi:hypothetical protein
MDDAARFLADALAQGRPAVAIPLTHHRAGIEERIADVVRAASANKSPACLLLTGEFTAVAEGQTP